MITTAIHVRSSETALPVTVLAGDELHEAVRSTIGDTLSLQPGISNASFGPAVGQPVIRGQQGRRVMNLTNNMPNADASGNSADHAQTVEAILANSIEVLRGPSTLLYGGGAIGGVVNVVDRRIASSLSDRPMFSIEARHDTASEMDSVVGSLDFATGNLMWHIDAVQREWNDLEIPGFAIDPRYMEDEHEHEEGEEGHEEEEHEEDEENTFGYVENTGGKTTSVTGGFSWIFDNGHLGFAVSELDNEYGLLPGAHDHAHEEEHEDGEVHEEEHEEHGEEFVFIEMDRTRYDVNGEWRDLAPWAETVDYRLSYTDYSHAEIEGEGEIGTQFSNEAWNHRLQITHTDSAERHGVIGFQYNTEEFAALGEESFIPVTEIDSTGLFLVEDFHAMAGTIELGGRVNQDDYNPKNSLAPGRDFTTWSLSGSALWDMNANTTIGVAVSRSQRAPSVEELYSNYGLLDQEECVIHFATGACEIGNTELDEETSFNTDLTLNLDYERITATFTLFYNDFSDYIAQVTTGDEVDEFPVRAYAQDDARFTGLEADVNFMLNEVLSLRLFGDAIRGKFDNFGDAPRMPPNRFGIELNLSGGQWSGYARLVSAREQNKPGEFEIATNSWSRLDIGANYTIDIGDSGELMFFVNGRNLGDEEIRLSTSYLRGFAPEAVRSVEAGFRFRY